MDAVLKGIFTYFFLVILFGVSGKRSLAEIDTFDAVLLLIISEAAQNALVGQNYSVSYAVVLILTLVGCEILMTGIKRKVPKLEAWLDGAPLVIVRNGIVLKDRLKKSEVDEDEILSAARETQGLERMDQIKYAVIENSGQISIIPVDSERTKKTKKSA
jgi:uncharacterized membrane protein YcaP (DUF421 family)